MLLNDIIHFQRVNLELTKIFNKYTEDKLVKNILIDNYKRELERYGGKNIVIFENIFSYDSKLVISIIKYLDKVKKQNERWEYSIDIIDIYLDAFNFSIESKIIFSEMMKKNLGNEFNSNKVTNKFINDKSLLSESFLKHSK